MRLTEYKSFFVIADGTPINYHPTPPWLTETRQAIKFKNFEAAIEILTKTAEQGNSAEWDNLMGFALGKKTSPVTASPS